MVKSNINPEVFFTPQEEGKSAEDEDESINRNIAHVSKEADLSPKQTTMIKGRNSKSKGGKGSKEVAPVRTLPKTLATYKINPKYE